MIIPTGMILLTRSAGPKRIGRVMAIVGVPMLLGPVLGPIFGGYLVDYLSWRMIFFINLPIGALAILAAARILHAEALGARYPLDTAGLLLLSSGLGSLVFGLAALAASHVATSATIGWFGQTLPLKSIVAVALGACLTLAFIARAWNHARALIDVRLFTQSPVGVSALTTLLLGAVLFGIAFVMPLYLQSVRHETAAHAGLLLAVQGLGAMMTMPLAGRLTDRTGPRYIVVSGLLLCALGLLLLSQIATFAPTWKIEVALFVIGLGFGASLMPTMSATLRALRREEIARATSGLNVVLRVGGSIGTALLAVILTLGERAYIEAFLCALGLIVLAFIPAFFLPHRRLEQSDSLAAQSVRH
jgi:EmrB/QacA subfamily drug resistance transporter